MPTEMDHARVDAVIAERLDTWLLELLEFSAIPSETGRPDALLDAARWTATRLAALGATVRTIEPPGAGPPLVVADIGSGPRTLLAVHHYDVQPAGDHDAWSSPPYAPHIRDGRVWGRGTADDKGALLSRIWGLEALLAVAGELPCRVRFLVEGEEESGSPHLAALLATDPELTRADGALIEGGATDAAGRPVIVAGMRGMALLDLHVRTLRYDAHSAYAMLLPNAAVRMAQAVASLFGPDGRPAVEGLSADARPPTEEQRRAIAGTPGDVVDGLRDEFGIAAFLGEDAGGTPLERSILEVTLNLQALWAGHAGRDNLNIVPAEAHARLDARLLPGQDPARIVELVRDHLVGHGFQDVEVTLGSAALRAWWTPIDHPILRVAAEVSSEVFGAPATTLVAESGAGPMEIVCAPHRVPMTSLGGGHEDCRAHAPDENFRVDHAAAGARCMARFASRFAALGDRDAVAAAGGPG